MADYDKIAKSKNLVVKKLIEELREVDVRLSAWIKQKDSERSNLQKKIEKETVKKKVKRK
jgi:hypothetical protein